MLVVSDSSPLNFLIRLGCEEVLHALFGRVLIPPTVQEELSRPTTPQVVRDFIASKPAWLEVRSPTSIEHIPKLDAGEEAAISLAREVKADVLLMDEKAGRQAAAQRGFATIGLLGILDRADERGLIDFEVIHSKLPADYRIDPALVEATLERSRLRRQEEKSRIEPERTPERERDDPEPER